jgi:hypothetical protein
MKTNCRGLARTLDARAPRRSPSVVATMIVLSGLLMSEVGCAHEHGNLEKSTFTPSSTPGIGNDLLKAPKGKVVSPPPGVDLVSR